MRDPLLYSPDSVPFTSPEDGTPIILGNLVAVQDWVHNMMETSTGLGQGGAISLARQRIDDGEQDLCWNICENAVVHGEVCFDDFQTRRRWAVAGVKYTVVVEIGCTRWGVS